MHFNFKQCNTDYPDTNLTDLIYRNTIQAQEYYADILMGTKVRFEVKCIGDRYASISQESSDITGDLEHEAETNDDRPDWATNNTILSMRFFKDSALSEPYSSSIIAPFGEDIYLNIAADESAEDLKIRITDCWATKKSGKRI